MRQGRNNGRTKTLSKQQSFTSLLYREFSAFSVLLSRDSFASRKRFWSPLEDIIGDKHAEGSRQQAVKAGKEKTSGLDTACCLLETTVKGLSRLIACHRFGCGR
jgi:hypothetical protein